MTDIQKEANLLFGKLIAEATDKTTSAGRRKSYENKEGNIFNDIVKKLQIKKKNSVLDIGCGYGNLTEILIKYCTEKKIELSLLDIEVVISKLESVFGNKIPLYKGVFPNDFDAGFFEGKKYDRILAYSVIHYSADPYAFIGKAVELLKPGGKLLIGDIPTVNKRGRFITSLPGKKFEAKYQNIKLKDYPFFKNHIEFEEKQIKENVPRLNDDFILNIIKEYRRAGYDVYILYQPNNLPFHYTREDILICKHD